LKLTWLLFVLGPVTAVVVDDPAAAAAAAAAINLALNVSFWLGFFFLHIHILKNKLKNLKI